MRRVSRVAPLLLCAVFLLCSCKSVHLGGGKGLSGSPTENVEVLLDQGKIVEASDIVVDNEAYFAGSIGEPETKAILVRLSAALDYTYSPQVQTIKERLHSIHWPVPRSDWKGVKDSISHIRLELDELGKLAIFKYPRYRPAIYGQALLALQAKEDEIRADAPKNFVEFSLVDGKNFFVEYPVHIEEGIFLDENKSIWSGALADMKAADKAVFIATYGANLPHSAQKELAQSYFLSLCPKGKDADLKNILAAYEKTRAAGLDLQSIPGIKIAFLQVTSPDLIKDKALDFGVDIKLDMPFDASKASMRKAFSHGAVKNADILILVNMAVSKAKRVVEENETISSTYVASYGQEINPEYEIAKAELEAASVQHHAAQSKTTTSWAVDVFAHWDEESKKTDLIESTGNRYDVAKKKMRTTPKHISIAQYQPYPVTKAHMDIYKFATVNYYVIDKRKKVFFKDTFDVSEKSFFTVCYAMEESDPNKEKFLQTSVLEDDVVRYEMEPIPVNLSDLLEQFATRPSEWKRYASMESIHRTFTKDRSLAQRKHHSEKYEIDKYSDKRFDSVVVVRNTGQGMGTGFYVTGDMIITNYHVVEEANYVQLKRFDQRETMGRVIARDAYLDLALIQADMRGKPVCFYNKRTLPIGKTLEVIGHPNGYEFSISRGVVSTVRKTRPINFPSSNKKILYIQTDAATNGGNSGGPVFFGKYVVGVNDWGQVTTSSGASAQGLNFSIHYAEVFKFLDQNGIRVSKGSK